MPALAELQAAMRAALVDAPSAGLLEQIARGALSPAECLSIHRNTMLGTLTHGLRLTYPAVQRMVGAEFFDAAAATFARAHLPRSPWLDAYGEAFAGFLEEHGPARPLAWMPDLARLEWAVSLVARARPDPPLRAQALSGVPAGEASGMRFLPHPSLHLLDSRFPIDELWRAALAEDVVALAGLDLDAGPVLLLARRSDADTGAEVIRLSASAMRLTRLLAEGCPLGRALAQVPEEADGRTLALHLSGGSFRGFQSTGLEPSPGRGDR